MLRGVSEWTTVDLLGPLNAVEHKYAPRTLWTQGDVGFLQHHPRVAVVGTRSPSLEGRRRTVKVVQGLVKAGAVVVSGLALGVDTIAHTKAIEFGGRTIAVLGTPLEQTATAANAELQRLMGTKHLLVSEFAPASAVTKGNFPRRNRTMALLSDASVIVEAGATSGTQSQGWEALRLGRPLFLLRSLVDSGLAWPREMLDHGAYVLNNMADLLGMLPAGDLREAVAF